MQKKMVNLKWLCLLLIFVTAIVYGCSGGSDHASSNQENTNSKEGSLSIRFGHHHPVGGSVDQLANKFAEIVKEKSDGTIQVKVYPGGQLGQEQEAVDGVNMGTMQMSVVSPGLMNNYSPIFGIESLPFLFDDWDHAEKALNGTVGEELRDTLLEKSNIRVNGYLHLGFRHMITGSASIEKMEDMKGLKMRSPESWVWIRMFELLGAYPTPVTWGEAYTAMQTGVVEGMETPASGILDMKFHEVAKKLFLSNHMFGTICMVTNQEFYQGLSAEQKKIIDESAAEALSYTNDNVTRPADENAVNEVKKLGMTVVEMKDIEKWREAVQPMYAEFNEKAPGADKIFQMIQYVK